MYFLLYNFPLNVLVYESRGVLLEKKIELLRTCLMLAFTTLFRN